MTYIDRVMKKMLKVVIKANERLTKRIARKPSFDNLQAMQYDLKFLTELECQIAEHLRPYSANRVCVDKV